MDLQLLKQYIQIDHDLDDELITLFYQAAKEYITNAIEVVKAEDPRFKIAVSLLVSHFYENRFVTVESTLKEVPFGVQSLIQQLRGVS